MTMMMKMLKDESSFFTALTTLLFLVATSIMSIYVLLVMKSLIITFFCIILAANLLAMFLVNKNLIHQLLRPVAVVLMKMWCSIEVEGEENLEGHEEILLAGNHTGLLDALIVSVACNRPVNFIMTNEVFSWPIAGKIVQFFNVIPVIPGKGSQALDEGIDLLKEGKILCIFPEGRCTEDGSLNRFHRGVGRIQSRSNAPLVPFVITGGKEAWPIAGLPKPHKVVIRIGQPLECFGLKEKEIVDLLKDRIQHMKDALERREAKNSNDNEVVSIIKQVSAEHSLKEALKIKENGQYSRLLYSELSYLSDVVYQEMIKDAVTRADRVAILSESRPEWAIAFFAAVKASAVVVPLDKKLTLTELDSILNDCAPAILVVSEAYLQTALQLKEIVPSIKEIYLLNGEPVDGVKHIKTFKSAPAKVEKAIQLNSTALIVYTSGTTGSPKGVMISYEALLTQVKELQAAFKLSSNDKFLSVLPLNHMLELTCGFLGVLNAGGSVTYSDKISPKTLVKLMNENESTYVITVPLLLKAIKKSIEQQVNKLSGIKKYVYKLNLLIAGLIPVRVVRKAMFTEVHKQFGGQLKGFICGGAPLDKEIADYLDLLGLPVYEGYGLTETSPVIAMNVPGRKRNGSVGQVLNTLEIKLADQDEIIVKGQTVMQGYYGRTDLTNEAIDVNGWFRTGDSGRIDNNGFLYITGRIKNMVVLGNGKKVFPEEVETALTQCQMIKEICVLGIDTFTGNKKGTEKLCAVIVPADQFKAETETELEQKFAVELQKYSEKLAVYKRPGSLIISKEELPKTSTKKIKRQQVRMMVEKRLSA